MILIRKKILHGTATWDRGLKNLLQHRKRRYASSDPCTELYAGPRPFSEPETNATARFIQSIKGRVVVHLTLHANGQLILLPAGNSIRHIEDYDKFVSFDEKNI
jgi:hypothetical protein